MITITEQYIKDYKDKLDKIAKSFDLDKQKIIVEELTIKVSAQIFGMILKMQQLLQRNLIQQKKRLKMFHISIC